MSSKQPTFKYLLILPILIVIVLVVRFGFFRCDSWKTIAEDAPFCDAGKKAVSKKRTCYPPPYVPAVEWDEYGWDTGNRILQQSLFVDLIDSYLYKIGFIKQQEPIGAWVNDIQQHVAPYRFFIVSIEPVIVVMTPYDYGTIEGKSTLELAAALNEQHLHYSRYLVNGYHYGSSVPAAEGYKWFCPENSYDIQEVNIVDKKFTIKTKDTTLKFGDIEKEGWYLIRRF